MPQKTAILLRTGPDNGRDWRLFAAIICCIEFYHRFVVAGAATWNALHEREASSSDPVRAYWLYLLLFLHAVVLLACGRALWLNRPSVQRYLWIAGTFTILAATLHVAWVYATVGRPQNISVLASVLFTLSGYDAFLGAGMPLLARQYTPILVTLIAAGIIASRKKHKPAGLRAPWVILAATWCLATVLIEFTGEGNGGVIAYWMRSSGWLPLYGQLGYAGLVVAAGATLLLGWRVSRTCALALAGIAGVIAWEDAYLLPMLVNIAIQALFISVPLAVRPEYHHVWSNLEFLGIFVHPVQTVGPWLLIAFYARFVRMWRVPDDGSPWPQRYCGKCWYNLQGLVGDRCPECGSQFDPAGEAEAKTSCAHAPAAVESSI